MEYNYDEESVNALINRAETAQLPQEVTLSEAEHIFDIKQHYPDAFYNPAIDRLYRLKEFVEEAVE